MPLGANAEMNRVDNAANGPTPWMSRIGVFIAADHPSCAESARRADGLIVSRGGSHRRSTSGLLARPRCLWLPAAEDALRENRIAHNFWSFFHFTVCATSGRRKSVRLAVGPVTAGSLTVIKSGLLALASLPLRQSSQPPPDRRLKNQTSLKSDFFAPSAMFTGRTAREAGLGVSRREISLSGARLTLD